jgi:hypothetical protein
MKDDLCGRALARRAKPAPDYFFTHAPLVFW